MLTCPLFNQSRNGVQLCNISLSCSLKTKLDGLSITFQVPTGETLTFGDDSFMSFEETGVKEVQKAAFVLVAGGLGERLGYNGIKVYNLLTSMNTFPMNIHVL